MMKIRKQMTEDERWTCIARGWISYDKPTGQYITRSYGRRRSGRPAKYFFYRGDTLLCKVTASSEEEAVQKANEWLEKTEEAP